MSQQLNGLYFIETAKSMPLMTLPVRTTLVKLERASVLLSPGSAMTEAELQALGSEQGLRGVTDIVAPSLFHCGGIPKAAAHFPDARVWGAPAAKKAKPAMKWTDTLTASTWPFADELPAFLLEGMPEINEVVFFHRKSKSLIVTDLCFNMTQARGFGPWLILGLFGTYRRLGVSRFFLRFVNDRSAFQRSLERIFAEDFENVIVGHGDNVIGDGKRRLAEALALRGFHVAGF